MYGFRTGHSCETQLVTTIEDLALSLECGQQVDMLILDFSKAFDTVAHQRLLQQTRTLWYQRQHQRVDLYLSLTTRTQKVVVDGEAIYWGPGPIRRPTGNCTRTLDVPPLHQWHRSQNIDRDTSPALRWWQSPVQRDTVHTRWHYSPRRPANTSRMVWYVANEIPSSKMLPLTYAKKKTPLDIQYEMLGHNLERVEHYPYLGVEISRWSYSWTNHVKISHVQGWTVHWVLCDATFHSMSQTSQGPDVSGSRPTTSGICGHRLGPIHTCFEHQLVGDGPEAISTICHWKLQSYSRLLSLESCLTSNGPPYRGADRTHWLYLLYRSIQGNIAVSLPSYITICKPEQRDIPTRKDSSKWESSTQTYQNSFFPRTVRDWNDLPPDILEAPTAALFKTAID